MTIRLGVVSLSIMLLVTESGGAQATSNALLPRIPGRMVDIGGYRLHTDCGGKGSPVVILENGLGDNFADWALVQPRVAKFTKVCSYDRAYDGFSDAGPIPVTMHRKLMSFTNCSRQGNFVRHISWSGIPTEAFWLVSTRVFTHPR